MPNIDHIPRFPPQQENLPPRRKADFHFLLLAPALSGDYFFEGARLYWETFKVIVLYEVSIIDYIPRRYSVAITSIARSDTASIIRDLVANTFGERVYHDPLVYDFLEDLKLTLDARATRNEPFGVPLDLD